MAITRVVSTITIGSLPGTQGSVTSSTFSLDQTCINAQVHINANSSAPGSGEICDVYLLQSRDDPPTEFDGARPEHALPLGTIDTNAGNDEQITAAIPIPQGGCQLHVVNRGAASMTLTASVTEQRSA